MRKRTGNSLILPSIVGLGANEQNYVVRGDAKQDFVAGMVERLVFVLVDLRRV